MRTKRGAARKFPYVQKGSIYKKVGGRGGEELGRAVEKGSRSDWLTGVATVTFPELYANLQTPPPQAAEGVRVLSIARLGGVVSNAVCVF